MSNPNDGHQMRNIYPALVWEGRFCLVAIRNDPLLPLQVIRTTTKQRGVVYAAKLCQGAHSMMDVTISRPPSTLSITPDRVRASKRTVSVRGTADVSAASSQVQA